MSEFEPAVRSRGYSGTDDAVFVGFPKDCVKSGLPPDFHHFKSISAAYVYDIARHDFFTHGFYVRLHFLHEDFFELAAEPLPVVFVGRDDVSARIARSGRDERDDRSLFFYEGNDETIDSFRFDLRSRPSDFSTSDGDDFFRNHTDS